MIARLSRYMDPGNGLFSICRTAFNPLEHV
jgi:hypothetical protein